MVNKEMELRKECSAKIIEMCIELESKGYCYVIGVWNYLVGALEILYAIFVDEPHIHKFWIKVLLYSWIPLLIGGVFLFIGACLSNAHRDGKILMLKLWIGLALGFGILIILIKIGLIVHQWDHVEIWRNMLSILVLCCFILLVVAFVYFPAFYAQELDEED